MAAEPVRLLAAQLDPAPAHCRACAVVILALSLASWAAIFAGTNFLLRRLF